MNKYYNFRYLVLILLFLTNFACYQEKLKPADFNQTSDIEYFANRDKINEDNSKASTDKKCNEKLPVGNFGIDCTVQEQDMTNAQKTHNTVETSFIQAGLVDVHDYDSTFIIELKYSTTDNFVKTNVYGDLTKCYLQPEVAQKLKKAHDILKQKHPDLRFKIWDGARPLSVQKLFWELIDKPEHLKRIYLAPPDSTNGSIHNYGCGVDLTLVKTNGEELDMGTEFDHFSYLAYPTKEDELLEKGQLSTLIVHNRRILRSAMLAAGFIPTNSEWWHFSAMSRQKAKNKYKIIK